MLFAFILFGQDWNIYDKSEKIYLKFLPSGMDPQDIRPSDIPSEQVLKEMGLSE